MKRKLTVLLVEDDPEDVELTREALKDSTLALDLVVVEDGIAAMAYVRRQPPYAAAARPDLILLDLNMPRKDGREVLQEIKSDVELRAIPVIVLTTSKAQEDIVKAYGLGANCYITKPVGLAEFNTVVRQIENFWLNLVKLRPSAPS